MIATLRLLGALCLVQVAGQETVFPGDRWEQVAPESQGVDPAGLEEAIGQLRNAAGPDYVAEMLVVRHGRLIWSGPNIDRQHPFQGAGLVE
jgi:hypothetical protein